MLPSSVRRGAPRRGFWRKKETGQLGHSALEQEVKWDAKDDEGHPKRLCNDDGRMPTCDDRSLFKSELAKRDEKQKGKYLVESISVVLSPLTDPTDSSADRQDTRLKTPRKVAWADSLDRDGHLRTTGPLIARDHTLGTSSKRVKDTTPGHPEAPGKTSKRPSYKEALLPNTTAPKHATHSTPTRSHPLVRPPSARVDLRNRCFKCLSRDHRVKHCRDPLRRAACFRTGHLARSCPLNRVKRTRGAMQGVGGFRPVPAKVFIPLTEEFHTRQTQRQGSVLADVIGRANLGNFP